MSDVEQFMGITGCDAETAKEHLEAANGNLEMAMSSFFEIQAASGAPIAPTEAEGGNESVAAQGDMPEANEPTADQSYTGPRTLDGRPAPAMPSSASASSSSKPQSRQTGVSSLGDLLRAGATGRAAPHGSDDDDDSDEDQRKKPQDFYTGGEKSGLAVEDPNAVKGGPNRLVSSLLKKASEAGTSSRAQAPAPQSATPRFFGGGGNTLGSEDAPSVVVPDPSARPARTSGMPGGLGGQDEDDEEDMDDQEVATRILTFWSNGFSIEDGPLQSYDDPASKALLESLNRGTAPLSVLNIRFGQRVDLQIANRQQEEYKQPPPRPMRPFEGGGNRLGSPAPSMTGASATPTSSAPPPSTSEARADFKPVTVFEVDASQPTTQIQIRLGNGERMSARFNHTHTVGDIIRYINASQPGVTSRPYVLQTTFPNRDLTDEKQTIKDAKLQNSVVTMRYT